jgi:hypothetical protein
MPPATLQFLITMIACAINERMQRKLDYTQEEVRVLKEIVAAVVRQNSIGIAASAAILDISPDVVDVLFRHLHTLKGSSIGISKRFLEHLRTLPDHIRATPITSAARA